MSSERQALLEPIGILLEWLEDAIVTRSFRAAEPAQIQDLAKLEKAIDELKLAPSWRALLLRHDGTELGEIRVLSVAEVLAARENASEGLVPVVRDADGFLYYLDTSSPDSDGDWPVVAVEGAHTEPAGTTLLRFLLAYLADSPAARTAIDPEQADHWIEWIAELVEAADLEGAWQVAERALCAARPVGPAVLVAIGETLIRRGKMALAASHFDLAMNVESVSARDEEARFDAAAERLALVSDDPSQAATKAQCLRVLGDSGFATAAVWREECLRAQGRAHVDWAAHAARVVLALAPDDADMPKFLEASPAVREAAVLAWQARQSVAQDQGATRIEEARRLLERSQAKAAIGVVLLQHARLLAHDNPRQSIELARRAAHVNPVLCEAYFQMGESYLLVNDFPGAEKAFRTLVDQDSAYGLAWSKLALAVLSQRRLEEALEFAHRGVGRSDEPFFTQSVLGDCLFELGKHEEAVQAYEEALKFFGHDHWTLHQTANAYVEIGNYPRAAELYDHAMQHNPDGCHQTLADCADLKRRMGRVGDAVRLYRQAIKMAPDEFAYRDRLKEVQKELSEAPN